MKRQPASHAAHRGDERARFGPVAPVLARGRHAAARDRRRGACPAARSARAVRRRAAASRRTAKNRSRFAAEQQGRSDASRSRANEQAREIASFGVKRIGRASFRFGIIRPKQHLRRRTRRRHRRAAPATRARAYARRILSGASRDDARRAPHRRRGAHAAEERLDGVASFHQANVIVAEARDRVRIRWLEQRHDRAEMDPVAQIRAANRSSTRCSRSAAKRPRSSRIAEQRRTDSLTADRHAAAEMRAARGRQGLRRTRRRWCRTRDSAGKRGSGRGSRRTFGLAAATAQTPSSPRRSRRCRPLSRSATARA